MTPRSSGARPGVLGTSFCWSPQSPSSFPDPEAACVIPKPSSVLTVLQLDAPHQHKTPQFLLAGRRAAQTHSRVLLSRFLPRTLHRSWNLQRDTPCQDPPTVRCPQAQGMAMLARPEGQLGFPQRELSLQAQQPLWSTWMRSSEGVNRK